MTKTFTSSCILGLVNKKILTLRLAAYANISNKQQANACAMLLGAAIVILYTVRGHVPKEARRCRHADSPRIHVRKWLWHPASCFCFPECASHACMLLLTAVAAGDLKRFVDCIDTRNAAHCQHATSCNPFNPRFLMCKASAYDAMLVLQLGP